MKQNTSAGDSERTFIWKDLMSYLLHKNVSNHQNQNSLFQKVFSHLVPELKTIVAQIKRN